MNKPLRRLAVIPSDPIEDYLKGGYSSPWLKNYYNPGHCFDEVYLLSPLEKDHEELMGMKVIHTPVKELKQRIQDLNIDVLRAYGGNWACRAACENKVKGVPVVVSVHDQRPEFLYDAIKQADIVLCVSNVVKKLVLQKFDHLNRVWVLPNRVDFEIMQPQTTRDDFQKEFSHKYKILFVGRLSHEKNLATVIKAMAILGKEYGLVIVGQGEEKIYQTVASTANVSAQCFFIGNVRHEDLSRYYSWCDCMCTPSLYEGFGMVFIEALASGAVVVTSNIAPMNEFIQEAHNGILVKDYENPQAIAEALQRACTDNDVRRHVKANARKSVESFERSRIDQLESDFYKQILTMKQEKVFEHV